MTDSRIVLFDLDGTLLDTAPDIAFALNQVRRNHQLPELSFEQIRPAVSQGIKGLLQVGYDIKTTQENFPALVEECFSTYEKHCTNATRLFPQMEKVLDYLDEQHIPWGVVTNKPKRFTFNILKNLDLETRTACIVCGDTLSKNKPDPEPILHACELLRQSVKNTVYVGDSNVDVKASKAAGAKTLVALYGYIGPEENPFSWNADGYIHEPLEIIDWLKQNAAEILD